MTHPPHLVPKPRVIMPFTAIAMNHGFSSFPFCPTRACAPGGERWDLSLGGTGGYTSGSFKICLSGHKAGMHGEQRNARSSNGVTSTLPMILRAIIAVPPR